MLGLTLFALLAAFGAAQDDDLDSFDNLGAPYGSAATLQGAALVVNANHNPNATRSIKFNPFGDDTQWTWRRRLSN